MDITRPTPRRASSYTRDNEWQASEWPAVTLSLLADHERLASTHDAAQLNAPLFALIRARKALNDARLSLRAARLLHKGNQRLCDRLESISAALAIEGKRFPLSIVGQGQRPLKLEKAAPSPPPFGKGFDAPR